MMNAVMKRPLFRQSGSPMTGERSAELRAIIEDIRANEGMREIIGNQEADNVSRQLGDLMRQPFEEFQGKYVRNPMSGEIEPMSGPLTGTPKKDPTFIGETVMVIDRRPNSETFGQQITVPRNTDTYEMIRSGMFEFNEIPGMAKGGEMESDAVGIADGLDREEPMSQGPMTANREPSEEGIAKVSPEQYVQLMNEVRGDEVPMEGRVQELASVVGEKDAQATPLSVLALVQPVFELQEQQGIAQTQQAQNMMPPMASEQLANPENMGIVRANTGMFINQPTYFQGQPTSTSILGAQDFANMYDLYNKGEMANVAMGAYTTGAADVKSEFSPEALLLQMQDLQKNKTFAEILQEKKDLMANLDLYGSQRDALKIPFYSGITQFGLDVARGENIPEAALTRFQQATSSALPMALQIKQAESQLPLKLAMSDYASQVDSNKEIQKLVLEKSFDLAKEREKNDGVGTVGVVGTNNDVIDNVFGEGTSGALPTGTIVQKTSTGTMSVIKPDNISASQLIVVKGEYVSDTTGQKEKVDIILNPKDKNFMEQLNFYRGINQKQDGALKIEQFIKPSETQIFMNIDGLKDGGEVVKRSQGTNDNPVGGEVSFSSSSLEDIPSSEELKQAGIDTTKYVPFGSLLNTTAFKGGDRTLAERYNLGVEVALPRLEQMYITASQYPSFFGLEGPFFSGGKTVSTSVDQFLKRTLGTGLPEEYIIDDPEITEVRNMIYNIPKVIATIERGSTGKAPTETEIQNIMKRLSFGGVRSAQEVKDAIKNEYKTLFDTINSYRQGLTGEISKYEEPKIFDPEYEKTVFADSEGVMGGLDFFKVKKLFPDMDTDNVLEIYKEPLFKQAINAIANGKDQKAVLDLFKQLMGEKYGF